MWLTTAGVLLVAQPAWALLSPQALGRLPRPSKGSESINKCSHATQRLLRGASQLLRGASQDAESRDAVDGTRERAVPILDTEQWLADVEGSAEPTELDTAYELESVDASGANLELDSWLETVDAEATLKADADAETTLLLTLSAGASTTFATAWQFALPLALLESGGPQAAATLMAATTGAKVLFAPSVGRLADKAPRVDAARAARAAQACGVGLSCLALPHLADETSWLPLLLAGSAIEALGAVVTKGAPRKDWAPTLLDGDALRKATVSLSNAALLGELAGPALGAFILGASGAPTVGAAAVAGELAAQAALERLRARAPGALSAPKGETTKAAPAWAAFFGQPSGAAITTVAFALLWFTALTPHAPVLLAALADRGAPAESLAAFRAAGALAGAGGVALYAAAADGRTETRREQTTTTSEARRLATRDVAALSIFGQVVAVTVAATFVDAPQTLMVAVVVSRVFLYAFDVAYVELQQQLVAEGDRNAVQGCEAALTGAAELGLAGVALAYATDFEVVADVSATAVVAAGLTFAAFLARRPELVSRPSSSSR